MTHASHYVDHTVQLVQDIQHPDGHVFRAGTRFQAVRVARGRLTLARYRGCAQSEYLYRVLPACVELWRPSRGDRFLWTGGGKPGLPGTVLGPDEHGRRDCYTFRFDDDGEVFHVYGQELDDLRGAD